MTTQEGTKAEDRILSRMDALETGFQALADKRGWADRGVYLNLDILYHLIDSYFQDVDRMKDYREITYLDRHKQAAFTIKWIAALRPVQIHPDYLGQIEIGMTSSLLLANETFAIHAGLGYMKIDIDALPGEYFRNLLYLIHFHSVAAEQMASEMYLLECCHKLPGG